MNDINPITRHRRLPAATTVLGTIILQGLCISFVHAAIAVSNIKATRHNFSTSASSTNTYKADTVAQVCVFCHAPHGVTAPQRPLWNRSLSNTSGVPTTYQRYSSASVDATISSPEPTGSSKLCLSCHDGVMAIGTVGVLSGYTNVNIQMGGNPIGTIPPGPPGTPAEFARTGFTRNLGTDLRNDHPISFTYDDTLAASDGELRRLTTSEPKQRDVATNGTIIGIKAPGYKPMFPLEPTGPGGEGQIECATCHDPHKADPGTTPNKFLRFNRLQEGTPTGGTFDVNNDQSCLACHDKAGNSWAQSAHASPVVADEEYLDAATRLRDYPRGASPKPKVWQRACLNCHDTHTVQGSRRLLREGVGGGSGTMGYGPGDKYQLGSTTTGPLNEVSAIENTCYQCHQNVTDRIINSATGTVPDIKTEFTSKAIRMPIKTEDQGGTSKKEAHDVTNSDLMETQESLGWSGGGNSNAKDNRHAECPDCHNPHRLRRRSTFYGQSANFGEGAKRTHNAGGTPENKGADGNVASGPLRGIWGVEPVFGPMAADNSWPQPTNQFSFVVKRGDPTSNSTLREESYLTREYQLCFKCHSNYANNDTNAEFPLLGNTAGGTPSGTNGITRYTNIAAEFGSVNATDPPSSSTDQGEFGNDPLFEPNGSPPGDMPSGQPGGDEVGGQNHRSWHPVMWPTGRTRKERTGSNTPGAFKNIRPPFNTDANIGYQTMYCSDCHGSAESWIQDVGPNPAVAQGPHGSNNPFLLKGIWNSSVSVNKASGSNTDGTLCGRCHSPATATGGGGFASGQGAHTINAHPSSSCMLCHIALPHGWKNKAFLVNLNCLGNEVPGYTPGCTPLEVPGDVRGYAKLLAPPYYFYSVLRIRTWRKSTAWTQNACGSTTDYSRNTWMNACGTGFLKTVPQP